MYNILILSNKSNKEFQDDIYIAESFEKDGHNVDMLWVDYDENLDEKYDIIIRRNTWFEDESQADYFKEHNEKLKERLVKKQIKTVNLIGLDGMGKKYLCELYRQGKKVVPTIDNIEEALKLEGVTEYVLKDNNSFGSGIGQKMVNKKELLKKFKEGYLIQPKIKFISEVQCYFVANKLMYVFEYTPSKYPSYPKPHLIKLNEEQERQAIEFANESGLKVGFQRIDFVRLENDEFLLLEIEDNSPYMSLDKLDEEFRDNVIEVYKKNIYKYLENG